MAVLLKFLKNYTKCLRDEGILWDQELEQRFVPKLSHVCMQAVYETLESKVKKIVDRIEPLCPPVNAANNRMSSMMGILNSHNYFNGSCSSFNSGASNYAANPNNVLQQMLRSR